MGHNVGKQAALAVAAGTKRGAAASETRTPDEIIKSIRGNLNSPLSILKTDVAVLLKNYDALLGVVELLQKQLALADVQIGASDFTPEGERTVTRQSFVDGNSEQTVTSTIVTGKSKI